MHEMIKLVKLQELYTTDAYDILIRAKINACLTDLKTCGIRDPSVHDPLVQQAVLTYCSLHLPSPSVGASAGRDKERLAASYNMQVAHMMSASGYGLEKEET